MNGVDSSDGWWRFLTLCRNVKTNKNLNRFFDLFLTDEERDAVAARFQIVEELIKGEKTQRQIAQELQVSIAKITRGSNYLKTIDKDLRDFLLKQIK